MREGTWECDCGNEECEPCIVNNTRNGCSGCDHYVWVSNMPQTAQEPTGSAFVTIPIAFSRIKGGKSITFTIAVSEDGDDLILSID
jgi:hypothetical protein